MKKFYNLGARILTCMSLYNVAESCSFSLICIFIVGFVSRAMPILAMPILRQCRR